MSDAIFKDENALTLSYDSKMLVAIPSGDPKVTGSSCNNRIHTTLPAQVAFAFLVV